MSGQKRFSIALTLDEMKHIRLALECIESDIVEHHKMLNGISSAIDEYTSGVDLAKRVLQNLRVGKLLASPARMADKLMLQGVMRESFYHTLHEGYEAVCVEVDVDRRVTKLKRA